MSEDKSNANNDPQVMNYEGRGGKPRLIRHPLDERAKGFFEAVQKLSRPVDEEEIRQELSLPVIRRTKIFPWWTRAQKAIADWWAWQAFSWTNRKDVQQVHREMLKRQGKEKSKTVITVERHEETLREKEVALDGAIVNAAKLNILEKRLDECLRMNANHQAIRTAAFDMLALIRSPGNTNEVETEIDRIRLQENMTEEEGLG